MPTKKSANVVHPQEVKKVEKPSVVVFSRWRRRFKRLMTSHEKITRAELLRYFVIPFIFSTILSLYLLIQVSVMNISRDLSLSILPHPAFINSIVSFPGTLFAKESVFDGAAVYDPYVLKMDLDRGELPYLLLDLRSVEEFETEHIRGAISLPTYTSLKDLPKHSLNEKKIMEKIESLDAKDRAVVVYAHTRDSKLAQDTALILRKNGHEVSVLGVGWNEWRHFRNLWLPEPEWNTVELNNYIEGREE
jgi:rhodanese-related sulfurtransferase